MSIQRVAVVGAGPAGLAAAKYLLAEKHFKDITVFEQRDQPGGVWNYTGHTGLSDGVSLPQAGPSFETQEPVDGKFVSPVYDSLETNIPKSLMNYNDQFFYEDTSLFPPHAVVKEYLHRYAEDLAPFIRYQSLVLDVSRTAKEWSVKWRNIHNGETHSASFDAVVVANGHHNDPNIPAIPGLAEWNRVYPGSIQHSASYRCPEAFTNKKVIVVGHSASGIDIAFQISTVSKRPLLISERTETVLTPEKAAVAIALPEIRLFDPEHSRIEFADGHEEFDVDHIVFCTGYHFSIPFLSTLQPPIITDGIRPRHLYKHAFYSPDPSLALVGFPQRIVPFPFSQAQGAWIARVFSGRLSLPSSTEMERWIQEWTDFRGDGQSFNTLPFPLDADYINSLYELSTRVVEKRDGLENDGVGKLPPYWGEKERWTRERFPLIKKASQALGSRRSEVTTLEELGFRFEHEKKVAEGGKSHL